VAEWRIAYFVEAVRNVAPELSWPAVIEALDQPDFVVPDAESLHAIVAAFHLATDEQTPFPAEALLKPWTNTRGQLSILRLAVANEHILALHAPATRYISPDGLISNIQDGPNRVWANVDLMETLLRLAETQAYNDVKEMLLTPLKQCPDVLIFSLAEAKSEVGTLQAEMAGMLLPIVLANFPSTERLVRRLWTQRPDMVVQGVVDWYSKDPAAVARIAAIGVYLRVWSTGGGSGRPCVI
jgi:CCR4-NOT transcription complex subunit 1